MKKAIFTIEEVTRVKLCELDNATFNAITKQLQDAMSKQAFESFIAKFYMVTLDQLCHAMPVYENIKII